MIYSDNKNPSLEDFKKLVSKATDALNISAKSNNYTNLTWKELEEEVFDALKVSAKGTKFEGSINIISGQKVPDIVACKYYGVEVKSSKKEDWTTLGGSVNESTRVEDVEHIFLTFGKLTEPVQFISRPYEECLSEVVVTHYPRYKIDMNLESGDTIFDRMKTTYNKLRLSSDPVGKIVDYYKSQLTDGESLWWTGRESQAVESQAAPMKIRLYANLSKKEKNEVLSCAFAYFPELVFENSNRYKRLVLWLASIGIVNSSVRDLFSAGGKTEEIKVENQQTNVSKAIKFIHDNKGLIIEVINSADELFLCDTWKVEKIGNNRVEQWISCAEKYSDTINTLRSIFALP